MTTLLTRFTIITLGLLALVQANAETMTLSTSNTDYVISTTFSDVDIFNIEIEINLPLAAGRYIDPEINSVIYQVMGTLEPGTPSEFPAFDLQRSITGEEFYAQGSSLAFEISAAAVLEDGVQAAELVGLNAGPGANQEILTLNAREIDNGRFHPALFQLYDDGTGRIQNSNNQPTVDPLVEVEFGAEYITDLVFDTGNTTLITGEIITSTANNGGGGGGSIFLWHVILLLLGWFARRSRYKFVAA